MTTTIPWSLIFAQAFNFLILIALGVFLLRKKLSLYFREKRESFLKKMRAHKERASQLEEERKKFQNLVEKIQNSFEQELEKTKKEAHKRYESLILEGQEFVKKLKEREEKNRRREEERVFKNLMQKLFHLSLAVAKENLQNSMTEEQKKLLEENFLNEK